MCHSSDSSAPPAHPSSPQRLQEEPPIFVASFRLGVTTAKGRGNVISTNQAAVCSHQSGPHRLGASKSSVCSSPHFSLFLCCLRPPVPRPAGSREPPSPLPQQWSSPASTTWRRQRPALPAPLLPYRLLSVSFSHKHRHTHTRRPLGTDPAAPPPTLSDTPPRKAQPKRLHQLLPLPLSLPHKMAAASLRPITPSPASPPLP